MLGIALAILTGLVFKKTLFRGEAPVFIMELPPYRLPSLSSLLLHTWEKGKHFVYKAGTYILAVSVVVWFLLNLPWGVEHKRDSYLGKAGAVVAPALAPAGFGTWEAGAALITGIIAKEIVVGTMARSTRRARRGRRRPSRRRPSPPSSAASGWASSRRAGTRR
ncbi:MAG: nucleoside recognition domain-containing protein [Anaeromyxobacteraceae bacterium]